MSRSTVITLLILISILCVVVVFVWYTQEKAAEQARAESPAGVALSGESNSFTDLDGKPVSLDSFEELTVAYVWASWCPQCQTELETLSRLATEYREQNHPVRFVAINRREPISTAERYLTKVDYSSDLNIVLDTKDNFYNSIEAYAMPEIILFDTDGNEVLRQRGITDFAVVKSVIDTTLEETFQ